MIRGAIWRRVIEQRRIAAGIEVVVDQRRLVGIDVPFDGCRHLWNEAWRRKRVVECSGLAVEVERIRAATAGGLDEVGESGRLQDGQWILGHIGIQIAHDEIVGITARRRVERNPVRDRRCRIAARQIAIALAVTRVRISSTVTTRAFRFQVIDYYCQYRAIRVLYERLRERRPTAIVIEPRIDVAVENCERTLWCNRGRLVNVAYLDRVTADRSRIHKTVTACPECVVHCSDDSLQ